MPRGLTSGFTCSSPTTRLPLHSSTHSAHGHRPRSHFGPNFESLPSSQRMRKLPSPSKERSVGRTIGPCGLILSSSPRTQVNNAIWYGMGMLRSARIFQLTALPYEFLARAGVWERHCAQMAAELPAGARLVLDLGCGPGNSTIYLRDRVGPAAVGGDRAIAMLRRAHRRDRSLRLACLDAGALPFRSNSLDAVTMHSVLYLLPDQKAALEEVTRVLRPGGRLVLLEPQAGLKATILGMARALPTPRWALTALLWRTMTSVYGRFSADALWAALEGSGLRVRRIEESLGGLGLLAVAEKD